MKIIRKIAGGAPKNSKKYKMTKWLLIAGLGLVAYKFKDKLVGLTNQMLAKTHGSTSKTL